MKPTKKSSSTTRQQEVMIPRMMGESFETMGYYLINDDIDNHTTGDCIKYIIEQNITPDRTPQEIRLMINSPGGDVQSANALIDIMCGSRIPVSTFGFGTVASAGLLIYIAGQKGRRLITPNTSILSHQFSWGFYGKEHELYAQNKELEFTTQRMMNHYKKFTGLNEKRIRELLLPPHDVFLTAQEAVKYGLADKIVDFIV